MKTRIVFLALLVTESFRQASAVRIPDQTDGESP